jgi:hypothetical protein
MTEPLLEFPKVIDRALWARADCIGVAFLAPQGAPPGLGLLMRDPHAALAIFEGWRNQFGSRDEEEIIRVAIIEGDIPGKPTGYTLTMGVDVETFARRLAAGNARGVSFDVTAPTSWMRRMPTPPGGSPHLRRFKDLYEAACAYTLVPVIDRGEGWEPRYEHEILKRRIVLRRSDEIGPNDPDRTVLA